MTGFALENEHTDEPGGPPLIVASTEERRDWLHLDPVAEGAVCAASETPHPHGTR